MKRLGLLLLLTAATGAAEDPKGSYWLHCAGCHGLDGSSAPPEVPTLLNEPGRIAALPGVAAVEFRHPCDRMIRGYP